VHEMVATAVHEGSAQASLQKSLSSLHSICGSTCFSDTRVSNKFYNRLNLLRLLKFPLAGAGSPANDWREVCAEGHFQAMAKMFVMVGCCGWQFGR
jgi:hypothetical protein